MSVNWYSGNAAEDGSERRGWILGHFIDPSEGVRSSNDVEIKWGIHPVGDKRPEWTADDQRTTLVLLVQGNFRIDLTETSITLEKQGDYAVWGPGIRRPRIPCLGQLAVCQGLPPTAAICQLPEKDVLIGLKGYALSIRCPGGIPISSFKCQPGRRVPGRLW